MDIKKRALELHQEGIPKFIPFASGKGGVTVRQYIVTLNEENTEYVACLGFLAQIARWFSVCPYYEYEEDKNGDQ